MRLIDADALIGELHTQFFYDGRDRTRMYERIQSQPTIEPERKTGKWVHDGSKWKNSWICSECGHIWMFEPAAFCDKCGAEMRG